MHLQYNSGYFSQLLLPGTDARWQHVSATQAEMQPVNQCKEGTNAQALVFMIPIGVFAAAATDLLELTEENVETVLDEVRPQGC